MLILRPFYVRIIIQIYVRFIKRLMIHKKILRCSLAQERRVMSNESPFTTHYSLLTSHISHLISHISYLISGDEFLKEVSGRRLTVYLKVIWNYRHEM